jgi:phosphomannomutase
MREINAVFAGESSGHYFLRFTHGFYEAPIIMVGKILEQLSESNQSFSAFIKPYKKYVHSGEINSRVSNLKEKINEIISLHQDALSISYLDGVSIEFENYWFNVRASNTEPLLRLNLEATMKDIMENQRDRLLRLIRSE